MRPMAEVPIPPTDVPCCGRVAVRMESEGGRLPRDGSVGRCTCGAYLVVIADGLRVATAEETLQAQAKILRSMLAPWSAS